MKQDMICPLPATFLLLPFHNPIIDLIGTSALGVYTWISSKFISHSIIRPSYEPLIRTTP